MKRKIVYVFLMVWTAMFCTAQPSNDNPCNAITLDLGDTCNFANFSTLGATPTSGIQDPGCAGYAGGDVWFKLTMPVAGQNAVIELGEDTIDDAGIAIYSGTDCNDLTLMTCQQSSSVGDLPTYTIQSCGYIDAGATFWIRVWENGNDNNGTFNICAIEEFPGIPPTVPACGDNEPFANNCCDAIIYNLCELDGFCSETNAGYTSDNSPQFCAIIDNNSWVAFIANNPTVEFHFEVGNCNFDFGIHAEIYQTDDCITFQQMTSDCFNPGPQGGGLSGSMVAENLIVGDLYYLMVDGWAGDFCEFTVTIPTLPLDITPSADGVTLNPSICAGDTVQLDVGIIGEQYGEFTYSWSPTESLQNPDTKNPIASPTTSTVYTVTVSGHCGVFTADLPVEVSPILPPDATVLGSASLCGNASNITYAVSDENATDFAWTIFGDGVINSVTDQDSIDVSWGPSGGQLCVVLSNDCGLNDESCFNVSVFQEPSISVSNPELVCGQTSFDLNSVVITDANNAGGTASFYATEADAIAGTSPLASTIVTSSTTYWIRVATSPDCYDVQNVNMLFEYPGISVTDPDPVCIGESIDLANTVFTEDNGFPGGTVTFHQTMLAAEAGIAPLTNTVVTSGTVYYMRYETPAGCADAAPVNVSFEEMPDLSVAQPAPVCVPATVDVSTVSITDVNNLVITNTRYFASMADAENGDPALELSSTVVSATGNFYVRQETATGCYGVAEINVTVAPQPQASMSGGEQLCAGDFTDLVFALSGFEPYTVVYSDGTNNYTLNNIEDGHVERVNITTDMTFTLISHTDAGSCVGNVDDTPVVVTVYEEPTVAVSGSLMGCPGETLPVTFDLTGDGPFDVVFSYGGNAYTLTDISDGHVEELPVIENESIVLQNVYNVENCAGIVSGNAVVTEIPPLQIVNYTETCNDSYSGYSVSFEIEGGDVLTYIVNGSVNGTLAGNVFTSEEVSSLVPFNLEVSDSYGCTPVELSGMLDCSCTTASGTMSMDAIGACTTESVEALHNADENLNVGDILLYVLHDGSGAELGTNVYTMQASNIFTIQPGMLSGEQYYISAIVGPPDNVGGIDQSSPCFNVAPGQPVVFYEIPEGTISGGATICNGESAGLTFNFTAGTGPYDVVFTDNYNNEYTLDDISDGYIHQVMPAGELEFSYSIVSITDNTTYACVGTGSGAVQVEIMDSPLVSVPQLECNATATEFQVIFEVTGGDLASYAFLGPGSFDATTRVFTSTPYQSGADFYIEVSDANDCDPYVISGNYVCNCVTGIGTLDTTPLELCEGEMATPVYDNGETLDPDDVLAFVLHDGDDENLGNILLSNSIPDFGFDASVMNYNTMYTISAVAGNDNGLGVPFLSTLVNPCLAVSQGTPVIFYEVPSITIMGDESICEGEDTFISFEITGTGPFDVEYTDGVSTHLLSNIESGHYLELDPDEDASYTVLSCEMVSGAGCEAVIDPAQVTTSVMVADSPEITNYQLICDTIALSYVIMFELEGGDPDSYTVTGTPGTLNGNQFTSAVLAAGDSYYFLVDDEYHCDPKVIEGLEYCGCDLTVRPQITVESSLACAGDSNGSLSVTNVNGVPPFSFRWSNGIVGNQIDGLSAGWYYVTMTDGEICNTVDSVYLREPMPIYAELKAVPPSCYGEPDAMIYFENVVGGAGGPYMYMLDSIYILPDSTFHNMPSGQYRGMIMDADGCMWEDTIMVLDPNQLMVDIGADQTISLGDKVDFEVQTSAPVDTFYWSEDTKPFIPCLDCEYFEVWPSESLIYNITAIDEHGCVAKDRRVINVDKRRDVYVPSAFSPNNDGNNDMFTIYGGNDIALIKEMRVFSRWGAVVFGNTDFLPNNPDEGWNGKVDGKILQPGIFVYMIEVEFKDGAVEMFRGDVTLVR